MPNPLITPLTPLPAGLTAGGRASEPRTRKSPPLSDAHEDHMSAQRQTRSAPKPPAHGAGQACEPPEMAMVQSIIEQYIRPLIHGSQVRGPFTDEGGGTSRLEADSPGRLKVRLRPEHPVYFTLERPVAFHAGEKAFLEKAVNNIAGYPLDQCSAYPLLIGAAIEQAIAQSISEEHAQTVYRVLQVYTQWASETHEGKRTSHTTGIHFNQSKPGASDFYASRHVGCLKTLGSTEDTLLAIGGDGTILGMELVSVRLNNYKKNRDILAPIHKADIAMWTNTRQKAAISLTEQGDILIFKDKQLLFAKRRSHWRSFPHRLIMGEVIPDSLSREERESRKAVYLTALDIALTHRGACLGVFPGPDSLSRCLELTRPELLFSSPFMLPGSHVLASVVNSRKFYEIPRKLRADLCSVDGALIIDTSGTILTAGAILRTEGGPVTGGGRSAAAKALARCGFGIKISSDGYIEIYDGDNPPVFFA